MTILVISGVIGAGLALFFNGRSNDSRFRKISGLGFAFGGLVLLALTILVEAKKSGLV